jgi:hypothetical protein
MKEEETGARETGECLINGGEERGRRGDGRKRRSRDGLENEVHEGYRTAPCEGELYSYVTSLSGFQWSFNSGSIVDERALDAGSRTH